MGANRQQNSLGDFMKKLGLLGLSLIAASVQATDYTYIDDPVTGYDAVTGAPINMINVNSSLPSGILDDIYNMLPESQTVNPAYISSNIYSSIHFDDDAISATANVTFLNEGAGYRNSLGYFVYQTDTPPATLADVPTHTIIFPNASKAPDGDLEQGDRVELGIDLFSGQSLGFFVVPNGWTYNGEGSQVKYDGPWGQPFYSAPALNPEAGEKRHNVVFLDPVSELIIVGFDDQHLSQGDNDYNDVLFAVEISPFFAVDGVNEDGSIDSGYIPLEDDDGTGGTDIISHYPTQNGFATLMYEDLWPQEGDYDFNDLVVKYNMTRTLSSASELKRLEASYTVQSRGAGYHNGFALRLPNVDPSAVGTISLKKNGADVAHQVVESGPDDLVIIISPSITSDVPSVCTFYRTETSCQEAINTTFALDVTFSTPPASNTVGLPPFDPFIFAVPDTYHGVVGSPGRDWEVHLKEFAVTSIGSNAFFNTHDDASNAVNSYVTTNNMPWAVNITSAWDHPKEYIDIVDAYPEFADWVESSGASNTNWYLRSKAVTSNLYE
jgi:LruC domain-containing protein